MAISISPCFSTPRAIQDEYVLLNSLQDTSIGLFLNEEDLSHDLNQGDFDLRIFFDGRSLLKEKTYPQNIKLEIYTLVDDKKSLISLINRTVKNQKAAENIFFAIKLPRIESTTQLMFDIYDSYNMLNSTFTREVIVDSTGIESALESVPDFHCDAEDGECLLEYMLRHVTFSANYDRNLKTHVYKNDKGRYFVNIPIKKGRQLKKKVRGFNVSGGSGKSSGKNNSNFLEGYPFYEDGEEVSLAFWNDLRDAIQFSFKGSSDFMRFDKSGSLQLSTNLDKGFLNIAAGSSTKAPIVLNQGALLDTLTEGAIEYDGNNLYFTNGSSRQVIGAQGPAGPPGPAGSQGPAGPAGGGGGVDLSNGGFLNGNISFISTSMINNAVFNGNLQYRTGAVDGLVLTSDAAGNASWQSLASLVNGGSGAISSGALGALQFSDGAGGFRNSSHFTVNTNGYALIGDSTRGAVQIGNLAGSNAKGISSVYLGIVAGTNSNGDINNYIGRMAGLNAVSEHTNAIGMQSAMSNTGDNVIALGDASAFGNFGNGVTALGIFSANLNRGDDLIAFGYTAARENTGDDVMAFGTNSARLNEGNGVIAFGVRSLYSNNGDYSIAIGQGAGDSNIQGDRAILIGYDAQPASATLNGQLNIGDTIYGNLDTKSIAINKVDATPDANLVVNGTLQYIDGSQANGFVLTSDVNGFASWQAAGGGASSGIAGAVQFSDGSGGFSSNGDEFFWDDTNQRLGIARGSAQAALHVNGYALIGDSVNNVVALGTSAANSMVAGSQYVNALGDRAALGNNGDEINAFGRDAALNSRGNRINALGSFAASNNQGYYVNALGGTAAQQNTGNYVNALGEGAANYNIGASVNALGASAGFSQNGDNVNAFGNSAAFDNANSNVNAFGYFTARYNSGDYINAFGYQTAQGNSGDSVNAMGYWSAIGNSGDNVNALGYFAARSSSGSHVNAISYFAAQRNFGDHVNAMGQSSAMDNKKDFVNALGSAAAGDNNGDNLNAFGQQTAFRNQGSHVNAIGMYSARFNLGGYVNAIGYGSTEYNDGTRLNAFGYRAGRYNNGDYVNAIGYETLLANNGDYNIALGYRAGYNTRNGSENIMIGRNVDVADPNADNQLSIANTIYGNSSTKSIAINKVVSSPYANLLVNGDIAVTEGLNYDTNTARPICDATSRGLTWFTESGAGVKDAFEVCAKDAGDAYAWRVLY